MNTFIIGSLLRKLNNSINGNPEKMQKEKNIILKIIVISSKSMNELVIQKKNINEIESSI
jgi:hypothetical protein